MFVPAIQKLVSHKIDLKLMLKMMSMVTKLKKVYKRWKKMNKMASRH